MMMMIVISNDLKIALSGLKRTV